MIWLTSAPPAGIDTWLLRRAGAELRSGAGRERELGRSEQQRSSRRLPPRSLIAFALTAGKTPDNAAAKVTCNHAPCRLLARCWGSVALSSRSRGCARLFAGRSPRHMTLRPDLRCSLSRVNP
jgi:hypothetical protein